MINNIFYNDKIQWAAVAALVSFVGVLATFYSTWRINNKTIKANISSKTRIEWINQIRLLSADLISNYELLVTYKMFSYADMVIIASKNKSSLYSIGLSNDEKSKIENEKKYNEHTIKVKSLSNQLLLYFINDNEHKKIKNLINDLNTITIKLSDYSREKLEIGKSNNYYDEKIAKSKELTDELMNTINQFREVVAEYLNTEWEKVESGRN